MSAHGHWFVGPDNGVFTAVLHDAEVEAVVLPTPAGASPTFHGRDLFAPAAAALLRHEPLTSLGQPFPSVPVRLAYTAPHYEVEDLEIGPLQRTFADVTSGGLLAYVGSGGAIEIAVRNGSAARRLGVGVGGRIRARLG